MNYECELMDGVKM